MNVALKSYLSGLLDDAKVNTGYAYALQKCRTIVNRARSPLNPANIDLLKGFGDGQVTQRVRGHFAKEENRCELLQNTPSDITEAVHEALSAVLAEGQLGGKVLTKAMRARAEKTLNALKAFLSLVDVRDISLLGSCVPEILDHLQLRFPAGRKMKARHVPMQGLAKRQATKRKRESESCIEDGIVDSSIAKDARACRPLSGGWAIMVGLHLAGSPQTKTQLVKISVQHALCREPLVKPQRTVSRAGQWYAPWNSIARLRKVGWVTCRKGEYALTDAGKIEANRYARQREQEGNMEGEQTRGDVKSDKPQECNASIGNTVSARAFKLSRGLCSRARCDAIDLSDSEREPVTLKSASSNLRDDSFKVLVDITEKQVVRESMATLLPSSVQLNLPGMDYAFGVATDGDWIVGNVLIERKTVHDYLATLQSDRGELQARLHSSLIEAGFSVAVVLEGINELRQHPQHKDIMCAAHASVASVLTTASMNDTAHLLRALASHSRRHEGWTLKALQVLLQHHYETSPRYVCEASLLALGVERKFAHAIANTFGSLSILLVHVLPKVANSVQSCDEGCETMLEAKVEDLAAKAGITQYQMGKIMHALGLTTVPFSRKRGPRGSSGNSGHVQECRRWRSGTLARPKVHVAVGRSIPKALKRCLQAAIETSETESLPPDAVKLWCGSSFDTYTFRIGEGTCFDPGVHWLILAKELDWQAVTARRASAYINHQVVSTLCTSIEQVSQHILSKLVAMDGQGVFQLTHDRNKKVSAPCLGLPGVFRLAQTAGGSLPLPVARDLAARLKGIGLVQLASRLKREGLDCLLSLGIRDLGVERASSVRSLLLGGA